MSFNVRANDRRQSPRFELIGSLVGTLSAIQNLPVRNLSCGGLLVHSPRALAVGSAPTIEVESATETLTVQARVVRAIPLEDGGHDVGLEILEARPAVVAQIQRMLQTEASSV